MTTPAPDYGDLSTDDLVKQINAECDIILAGERSTFTKAMTIAPMLIVVRDREKEKGTWTKTRVPQLFPKLSYETVTTYIRYYQKRPELEKKAAEQSVSLTLTNAGKLGAKPRTTPPKPKPKPAQKGSVEEPGDSKTTAPSTSPDDIIKDLAADELFTVLKQVYDIEKLRALSDLLRRHVMEQPLRRPVQPAAPPPS